MLRSEEKRALTEETFLDLMVRNKWNTLPEDQRQIYLNYDLLKKSKLVAEDQGRSDAIETKIMKVMNRRDWSKFPEGTRDRVLTATSKYCIYYTPILRVYVIALGIF